MNSIWIFMKKQKLEVKEKTLQIDDQHMCELTIFL